MLNIQSKDGKFDIVLSDATLKGVGNVKKTNIRSLSSAGRRKTKEIKGNHVLPSHKDESPRQLAKHKETLSQSHVKVNTETHADPKDAKKKTGKPERPTERIVQEKQPKSINTRNTNTKASDKDSVGAKRVTKGKTSSYTQPSKAAVISDKPGVISQSELMSLMESLKTGDVSILEVMTKVKGNQGFADVSKFNDKASLSTLKKDNISDDVIEPTYVPGLNLDFENEDHNSTLRNPKDNYSFEGPNIKDSYATSKEPNNYASRRKLHSEDSVSTISLNEIPRNGKIPNEDLDKAATNMTARGKMDRHAMRSSFVVGAPGQVAFDYGQSDREKNKQWLADLEKQMQEKKKATISEKERLAMAMETPLAVKLTSRHEKVTAEPESAYEPDVPPFKAKSPLAEKQADNSSHGFIGDSPNERGFARGQHSTKNQFELDEIERKRQKILEHQRAVEEQVEEKRRLKMIEKERKFREEREEEEKLAREREQLARQYEEEARKRMEKEEAERQRHLALQQSVLEAYDAAKKEKQNTMLRKLKAGGHDISKLEPGSHAESISLKEEESSRTEKSISRLSLPSHSMDVPFQISSRSDKEFRPILNLMDESYEGGKEKEKNNAKENAGLKDKAKAKTSKDEASSRKGKGEHKDSRIPQKPGRKSDPKKASLGNRSKQEEKQRKEETTLKHRVDKSLKRTKEPINNRNNVLKEKAPRNKRKENKVTSERLVVNHEPVVEDPERITSPDLDDEKGPLPVFEVENNDEGFESFGQYSYNRTSTITLEENSTSRGNSVGNPSRLSHVQNKDENSSWDSRGFPTERQQQILEQLQVLRKGLLDKQKEYEKVNTPSGGNFQ
ncbi:coiled-coil domain-containing protein 66-like [Rhopilema esculentum]|uniref:coiled-coil domain-containing protein 66-like n=1 Tax=Rhopilema esculentum TaxID=499914 RepID=UPI0031D53C66